MKLLPASVGAEPKKLAILGGLVAVLGGVYWMNRTPEAPAAASTAPAPTPPIPAIPKMPPRAAAGTSPLARRAAVNTSGRSIEDFRPSLKLAEGVDVSSIDPALHLDLLAKVRNAEAAGGTRSLFEFSQPPAPPPPKVAPIKPAPVVAATPPPAASTDPPKPPPPPPPPPITLKFYGYAGTAKGGERRAFFLDGEDIFVAGENDLVRNRYKIVRIGVNSAVVEDTVNKNQQTLPLVEEQG
jgi:hypothetical protein